MDTKSITAVIIGLMVSGLILVAFVPVFVEVTATDESFENDGYYKMSELKNDDEITIAWDHTKPNVVTVNDAEVSLANVPKNTVTSLVVTDGMLIRYAPITSDTLVQSYSSNGYLGAGVNAGTDMTIVLTSSSISATVGESTYTKTITTGYYVDALGEWVLKNKDSSAFINTNDSVIVLGGNTAVADVTVGILATGTIESGLEYTYIQSNSIDYDPTFGIATFNYTDVSGYLDLVKLTSCVFDITVDDDTATATYSYFLVPVEVIAEKAVHGDDVFNTVINLIPLLAGVGLLMAGVYYFISRK